MIMETEYDFTFVMLSVFVAIFASYVSLKLVSSLTQAKGWARTLWLMAGALTMGMGIWSMHFVGMLAVEMNHMPMAYDIPLMTLSILIAIFASMLAFFVISRAVITVSSVVIGGTAMAAAISGMHYVGMYSMRMSAAIEWDIFLVALSIVVALIASFAALLIFIRFRKDFHQEESNKDWLCILASIFMGLAVSGMHYIGMLAATFVHTESSTQEGGNLLASSGLAVVVIVMTLTVLGAALAGTLVERLLARRALDEERFRRVIESAPNGLLMIDKEGIISLCNAQIETIFGYKKAELVGRSIEILIPERFRGVYPEYRRQFFNSPQARQLVAGRDLYGLRKDGTQVPIEIGLNPLEINDGNFVLASIVDITVRKALEDDLRASAKALRLKNSEMEQFVSTVSHDLKSPLVTSTGFLGLLKEDIKDQRYDAVMDSIERLERANTRMTQLIDDLLQLSRVGIIELRPEKVDVAFLLKSICENLSVQLQQKAMVVEISEALPVITADKRRVYQVFENLIINALKYACTDPKPKIAIGSLETDEEIRFFVKDNGPGIEEAYHRKIFELFQRLENDNRGTGVGLTIVQRIMQIHDGRAWVESKVGHGTTFWLGFPKGEK